MNLAPVIQVLDEVQSSGHVTRGHVTRLRLSTRAISREIWFALTSSSSRKVGTLRKMSLYLCFFIPSLINQKPSAPLHALSRVSPKPEEWRKSKRLRHITTTTTIMLENVFLPTGTGLLLICSLFVCVYFCLWVSVCFIECTVCVVSDLHHVSHFLSFFGGFCLILFALIWSVRTFWAHTHLYHFMTWEVLTFVSGLEIVCLPVSLSWTGVFVQFISVSRRRALCPILSCVLQNECYLYHHTSVLMKVAWSIRRNFPSIFIIIHYWSTLDSLLLNFSSGLLRSDQ